MDRPIPGGILHRHIFVKVRQDEDVPSPAHLTGGGDSILQLKPVVPFAIDAELHIRFPGGDGNLRHLPALVLGVAVFPHKRNVHLLRRIRRRVHGRVRGGIYRRIGGRIHWGIRGRVYRRLCGIRHMDARHLQKYAEYLGRLRPGNGLPRLKAPVGITGQDPRLATGVYRISGVAVDGVPVRKRHRLLHRPQSPFHHSGKAGQEGGRLLPGHRLVCAEGPVRVTRYDLALGCPVHRTAEVLSSGHVGKHRRFVGIQGLSAHSGQNRDKHGASHGAVRLKQIGSHTVHNAPLCHILDVRVGPVIF